MKLSSSFAALATLVSLATASPAVTPATPAGAVYFISNHPSVNYVLAAQIGQDGLLSNVVPTYAQGNGSQGLPIQAIALFSQGPVAVNQETGRLAAVNAGTNTVQLFDIDPLQPTSLTAIGDPVSSGGDFPVSVAIDNAGQRLCVLNGGLEHNVQCFLIDDAGALTATSQGEMITYNQTANPPTGPAGTLSTVVFSPDQEAVMAFGKGVRDDQLVFDNDYPGYLRVWPISNNGTLGAEPFQIDMVPPTGGWPFSLSQIPHRNAFVGSDVVAGGAIVVDMQLGIANTQITPLVLPSNVGNCWSVTAPKAGTYFISDTDNNLVNEVQLNGKLEPSLLRQYNVSGLSPNEAVVGEVNGVEYMWMLMNGGASFGTWVINGPGDAELVQLLDVRIPAQEEGVDAAALDELAFAGMGLYLSQ
ncbi:unnamed protein product [Peniophora sp. CBMAI 1063]|nr:unnamed protein product [Peniophora sp. CBMAI 1063]